MDEILDSEYRTMNSPQSNNHENGRKPDPDAIKMFVGQVPRSMDENDLTKMFEQYGSVFQLNVLRDKATGQSKGCCFVTFYTRKAALDAQNALHNIKTLPGMHHPVQMKPADSEKRNGEQQSEERKLFIGMLSKKFNETDVKMMFAPFGNIEDCTVLRDQNGQSRGCAFITYSNRQSAQNCIKQMHHSQTMEGCSSPLVVKLADTQKEKEQKKFQQMNANLLMSLAGGNTGGGGGFTANIGPQYLALLQQAVANGNLGMFANMGNLGDASNNMHIQNLQGLAALANATSNPGGFNAGQGTQGNIASAMAALMQNMANFSGNMGPNMMGMKMDGNMSNMMGGNMGSNMSGSMGGNMGSNVGGNMGGNMGNNMGGNMGNMGGSIGGNMGNMMSNGMGGNMNGNMASMQRNNMGNMGGNMMQNMGGANQQSTNGGADGVNNQSKSASLSGSLSTSNSSLSGFAGIQSLGNNNMAATSMSPSITNGLNNNTSGIDALTQAYTGIQQYAASFPGAFSTQAAQQLQAANSPAGKQTEGPEGANLFIYHLPQEFSDHDLMQTFMPFGTVISAKVFIDKQTNLSKCFGFVSYDNAVSAQAAIQAMNGFQIGMKRLKVQLKRPKNDSKPY